MMLHEEEEEKSWDESYKLFVSESLITFCADNGRGEVETLSNNGVEMPDVGTVTSRGLLSCPGNSRRVI